MRKRRIKIKKLTTKQFRAMQNTIENRCCNYLSERCVLYDDGDYPLCVQHGLRYLVCPYFRDVVIHNNADLMEELLEIPKNAKQCRECRKFFVPTHCSSLYCPICRENIAAEKARKRSQNTGIRKRSTVTIVKKKVIAPQQFFLQNQEPWYSLSFLRERNELTVTISIKKLEKDT